jgi:flagellar basal body P-ring protein FlgI
MQENGRITLEKEKTLLEMDKKVQKYKRYYRRWINYRSRVRLQEVNNKLHEVEETPKQMEKTLQEMNNKLQEIEETLYRKWKKC